MENDEKLNKLFDLVIENEELTTKVLNNCDFNSRDINKLIDEGIITRVKRGHYTILFTEKLYHYGRFLISLNEYKKANKCFEKCYELNPNHHSTCFQLFLRAIQEKDYSKAFTYFDTFYDNENGKYKKDSNFYLYLLNHITDIPEKYKEIVKDMSFNDMKISFDDKRYYKIYEQNGVRLSAIRGDYSHAAYMLDKLMKENNRTTVQDIITETLLYQALTVKKNHKRTIVNLNSNEILNAPSKYCMVKLVFQSSRLIFLSFCI